MSNLQKTIAQAFLEMAEGLESGSFGKKPKIALTGMGSEHGEANAMQAALMAAKRGVDVYYIGTLEAEGVTTVHVENEDEGHKKMDELVESGAVHSETRLFHIIKHGNEGQLDLLVDLEGACLAHLIPQTPRKRQQPCGKPARTLEVRRDA